MSFPLSLKPSGRAGNDAEPLFTVLQKIYAERGHLRDVTEESLEAEVKSNGEIDADSGQNHDESDFGNNERSQRPQDIESRAKELQSARVEMLQLIGQANNEALTALDFVSLLLSREAPRQAEASISPALKSMAPSGTLGFDKTEASRTTGADQEQDKRVSLGLNFSSLNSAADKLLDSATRLEKQIHKETNFWEQILSVSDKGWNLCRIPGRNHTVGVRFGFSEATPRFRTRGLAPLKPDQDGSVMLDQAISEEQKVMRVRIAQANHIVETSFHPLLDNADDKSLDSVVHRARNSLFDEELFSNLLIDARDLFSNGVRVLDDQIIVPFATQSHPDRTILIDLVSVVAQNSETETLADSIALILRIFLTNTYRDRHRQRSSPPAPLTIESRQTVHSNHLLPFLSHIQHYVRSTELKDHLILLTRSLQSAQLDCSVTTDQGFIGRITMDSSESKNKQGTLTPMEHVVAALDDTLASKITWNLFNSTKVSININTNLSSPDFGTHYELTQQQVQSMGKSKPMAFSDYEQLSQFLSVVVRQSIAGYLSENLENWTLDADGLAVEHSESANAEEMGVLFSQGRLVLVMRKNTFGSKKTILDAWDGKSQRNGLLAAARKAASA